MQVAELNTPLRSNNHKVDFLGKLCSFLITPQTGIVDRMLTT